MTLEEKKKEINNCIDRLDVMIKEMIHLKEYYIKRPAKTEKQGWKRVEKLLSIGLSIAWIGDEIINLRSQKTDG